MNQVPPVMVVHIPELPRKHLDFLYGNDRPESFLRFKHLGYAFSVLKIVTRNLSKHETEVVSSLSLWYTNVSGFHINVNQNKKLDKVYYSLVAIVHKFELAR